MKLSLSFLVAFLFISHISPVAAQDRRLPELKTQRPMELFPLKEIKRTLEKKFADRPSIIHDRFDFLGVDGSKRTLLVHFEKSPHWNGIALLDANGNTLVATAPSKGQTDMDKWEDFQPFLDGVFSGDMNQDGVEDLFIDFYGRGAGTLTDLCEADFLLSSPQGYVHRKVTTAGSDAGCLVRFQGDPHCYFIVKNHAASPDDLDFKVGIGELPPLEEGKKKELIGGRVKLTDKNRSEYVKDTLLFSLTYALLIHGTSLEIAEGVDQTLPLIDSFCYHEAQCGSWGTETKLLTKNQKSELLKKDLENSLGGKYWW